MPRPIANGQIAFGLVSIPVKLFSAAETSEKISFNMLHRDCGNRVQQQLYCPKDERTIDRSEVVKGYEFSKGQYVLFNEEELKALEEKSSSQIEITEFVKSDQIDPIYFAKPYYLGPDKNGSRAYSLLSRALQETGRWAVAKYAARGKGYVVVIRPLGKGLVMQQLYYPNEIRSIDELELGDTEVKENELKMAIQLAEMSASEMFHPEMYKDEVSDRVRALIQQKVEGQEITGTADEEPKAQVIDLMEALRRSLGGSSTKTESKPSEPAAKPAPKGSAKVSKMPDKAKDDRKAPKAAPREPIAKTAKSRAR
ncbi:MAG TPA: Ku protein [Thermoanaerobaculia bacterium]|nr:Ku protein [Thermoanaerobaculia bacterium]